MKILVILSRVPFPLDKGDKLRAYNQLKRLSKNHEVFVFALNAGNENLNENQFDEISSGHKVFNLGIISILINTIKGFLKGLPFQSGYFYNQRAQKELNKVVRQFNPDLVYCQLIRTTEYAINLKRPIIKAVDYMDVLSTGMYRRMQSSQGLSKLIWKLEHERLARYEEHVFDRFDIKTIISDQDRNHLTHPDKSNVSVIPNGIDSEYFTPVQKEKTIDILFTGNMNYPPNIDSAKFLIKKVYPLVKSQYPDIRIMISGTNPVQSIKDLAGPNIIITGKVDDIRESYAISKIFVAPMNLGTGLQNKLLEAMAMELPCITTPLANNALKGVHDKHLLIGTNELEIAAHIISLLQDPVKARKIAENGREFAISSFNWDATTNQLEELFVSQIK